MILISDKLPFPQSWLDWDASALLWANGHHSPFLDQLMWFVSGKYEWIPLYLILLFLVVRKYKWRFWIILILIALVVTLTDQISVKGFKEVFERLRPCHEPALDGMVRILNDKCGGQFGFVSSHAANTFGLATLFSLLFQKRWITWPLLFWAALVSYSRVYLGVHYPLDVIGGAMLGAGLGTMVWLISVLIFRQFRVD